MTKEPGVLHRGRQERTTRRGVAAVECALVISFLAFLTLGMIEVARGMMVKEYLSNAARCGCRTAILPTGTTATVKTDVNNVLSDHQLKYTDATIEVRVNDKVADAN